MLLKAAFALHVVQRAIGVMIVIWPGILSYNQRVIDAVELDINPMNAIIPIIITDGYRSTSLLLTNIYLTATFWRLILINLYIVLLFSQETLKKKL